MAQIHEEIIVVRISKIRAEGEQVPAVITEEMMAAMREVTTELVKGMTTDQVVIEVEKA